MFDLPEPGMFDYSSDQWQALPAVERDRLLAKELAQDGGIECGAACSGEEQTPQQISKAADRLYAFAQQMGNPRKIARPSGELEELDRRVEWGPFNPFAPEGEA